MPVADKNDTDFQHEDKNSDGGEKGSKTKGSSKAKDLSHVPCKFFKVGSCTAGSSCPFSHTSGEPGHQKDVCAWFVKGNCKFGHKCALAHILPGQSMAMDRKNKKAAQVAANAGGGKEKGGRGQKKDLQGTNANGRNPLLSGSTAPTRATSSRPPMTMPLKATLSPSAPAPPIKDTEFASFGLPDENNKLPSAPAQGKQPAQGSVTDQANNMQGDSDEVQIEVKSPPSPLPLSTPSAPRRSALNHQRSSNSVDFGPIGSPPRSSPSTRINGFSPGTSPSHGVGFLSSSPFSAPGTQSVFLSYDNSDTVNDFKSRSGLAASLGATRTWSVESKPATPQVSLNSDLRAGDDFAVEEEDLEEFIPSSLTDLLTPEERSRRISRTNSGQPTGSPAAQGALGMQRHAESSHRYSRSVPAPSLLGDIKSIWSDTSIGLPESPDAAASPGNPSIANVGALGNGTPGSFKSNSGFGGRSFSEETHSPSFLSPSNASAAFLPGLHHHYLNSKGRGNIRGGPSPLHPSGLLNVTPNNQYVPMTTNDISRTNSFGNRPPFDTSRPDPYFQSSTGRPIPSGNGGFGHDTDEQRNTLSPSARALQAHAPGQSLPQGLAAGYSRIHALPPPPSIPSPAAAGAFSPPQPSVLSSQGNGNDWGGSHDQTAAVQGSSLSGIDNMFSRLSYSAAASRSNVGHPPGLPSAAPTPVPVGVMRNTSGRWQGQGPLSPLSGPVVTGDDDDLFSMDG